MLGVSIRTVDGQFFGMIKLSSLKYATLGQQNFQISTGSLLVHERWARMAARTKEACCHLIKPVWSK